MKIFNIKAIGLGTLLVLTSIKTAEAFSLEVFEPINEIVGNTSNVTGGGGPENFPTSVSVGNEARFRVRREGETEEFAQLGIVYSADNGVSDNQVMIAQTSNSQGLTDTATISILLNLDQSGGNGEFTFKWYEPLASGESTTPKNLEILYTTYDLDFQQEIFFDSSEAQSITLDGNTVLNSTIGSTTNIFDPSPGSNSTFSEPKNAVQILSQNSSSDTFNLGKTTGGGNALYMFEFRDPSNNIFFTNPFTQEVPFEFSPGLGLILGGSFLSFLKLRKKFQQN